MQISIKLDGNDPLFNSKYKYKFKSLLLLFLKTSFYLLVSTLFSQLSLSSMPIQIFMLLNLLQPIPLLMINTVSNSYFIWNTNKWWHYLHSFVIITILIKKQHSLYFHLWNLHLLFPFVFCYHDLIHLNLSLMTFHYLPSYWSST